MRGESNEEEGDAKGSFRTNVVLLLLSLFSRSFKASIRSLSPTKVTLGSPSELLLLLPLLAEDFFEPFFPAARAITDRRGRGAASGEWPLFAIMEARAAAGAAAARAAIAECIAGRERREDTSGWLLGGESAEL